MQVDIDNEFSQNKSTTQKYSEEGEAEKKIIICYGFNIFYF